MPREFLQQYEKKDLAELEQTGFIATAEEEASVPSSHGVGPTSS